MSTLRLYLRPAWPDDGLALDWSLPDGHGGTLHHGHDAPADWPRTDEVELILPAASVQMAALRVPVRQPSAQVLGYAMEEALLSDPSACLFAAGEPGADGLRLVAATEAGSIRRAVQQLRALGRPAGRILPEAGLLPVPAADEWAVAATATGWIVRQASGVALALPDLSGPVGAVLLGTLLREAVPSVVRVAGDADAFAAALAAAGCPAEVRVAPAADWRGARWHAVPDFATGELAANKTWRKIRPLLVTTLGWLAAIVLLRVVLLTGEVGYLSWQKARLSGEIRSLAVPLAGADAVPGDAALRAARAIDRMRLAHGLPEREGALSMLEAVAGSKALPALQSLSWQTGRLVLKVAGLQEGALERLRADMATRQIRVELRSGGEGGKELWLTREP